MARAAASAKEEGAVTYFQASSGAHPGVADTKAVREVGPGYPGTQRPSKGVPALVCTQWRQAWMAENGSFLETMGAD